PRTGGGAESGFPPCSPNPGSMADTNDTRRRASADDWAPRFLRALAACGCIVRAARHAQVRRRRVYRRPHPAPDFARALARALDWAMDRAEGELYRRGVRGVRRLRFHNGEAVTDPATMRPYVEREYSDRLLVALLQAHRPKYRPVIKSEPSGPDGGLIPQA